MKSISAIDLPNCFDISILVVACMQRFLCFFCKQIIRKLNNTKRRGIDEPEPLENWLKALVDWPVGVSSQFWKLSFYQWLWQLAGTIRNLLIRQKIPKIKDAEIPICFSRTSHFATLHMITRKHSSGMRTAHLLTGKGVVLLSGGGGCWCPGGEGVLLSRGWGAPQQGVTS